MESQNKSTEEQKNRTCSLASAQTVDLETAISKTGCGKFNWLVLLVTFPIASISVFVTGSMSYVISIAAKDFDLSPSGKAWLQSAPYAGMILSGYFWGFLSDAYGRRKLIIIGCLIDVFLNIGAGLVMSMPVILFFKFLSGLMVCGPYSIHIVYVSEVFPQQYRDMVNQFVGVFTSVGSIIQCALAMWLIPLEIPDWIPFKSWQLFIMCGGLPSLLCGLSFIFFYESPKFLIDKGQAEKALSVCRNIFTFNSGQPQLAYPVNKIQMPNIENDEKKISFSRILQEIVELFKPPFLLKTLTAYLIFIIVFSEQNNLRLWMPEIFTLLQNSSVTDVEGLCPLIASGKEYLASLKNVVPDDSVYIKMAVIHCSCLLSHLSFVVFVRCIKKKILLIGIVGVAAGCIFFVPSLSANVVLLPISIFLALLEVSNYAFLGAIVRIFPTHLRAKSVSLAMVLGRVVIFLGNFWLANVMFTHCELMFYTFAAGAVCAVILTILLSFTPHDDTKSF